MNDTSFFPDEIDNRIFFSELNIEDIEIMNQFEILIRNQKYTEALELLEDNDVPYYGAWTLNLFENRLRNIGNFLLNGGVENASRVYYQNTIPEELFDGLNWMR